MNCEDCGSDAVTEEVGPSGTARLSDVVRRVDPGEVVVIVRACWTCGWRETRRLSLDDVDVEPGEPALIRHAGLLDRLIELAESLDTARLAEAVDELEQLAGANR